MTGRGVCTIFIAILVFSIKSNALWVDSSDHDFCGERIIYCIDGISVSKYMKINSLGI